ncbi:hypothetical protein EIN_467860 [Entamoeba invadens IP1]|uniref:small monomeric GTPase n=1 Tax=Entamoeba invadens IP1 TaxID=370355 RepID=A0A0A1TUF5_ENTIV|nr:hypothetical protein EIN_467860 [Entamoeba invadens IP1]ELP83672.1 hypothetical protein EIN_467860 [Entamoeba invadens IP1]|eukprot:XP_004183018.1 hypothetical protein EIN_467860 [Entamoeba invadens IP1]
MDSTPPPKDIRHPKDNTKEVYIRLKSLVDRIKSECEIEDIDNTDQTLLSLVDELEALYNVVRLRSQVSQKSELRRCTKLNSPRKSKKSENVIQNVIRTQDDSLPQSVDNTTTNTPNTTHKTISVTDINAPCGMPQSDKNVIQNVIMSCELQEETKEEVTGTCERCVFVGDENSGKTRLILSYNTERYPPHEFDKVDDLTFSTINTKNGPTKITVANAMENKELVAMRNILYASAKSVVICFSMGSQESYDDVINFWLPEVRNAKEGLPIILCGTASETTVVAEKEVEEIVKKENIFRFVQCNFMTGENVKELFETIGNSFEAQQQNACVIC